MFGSCIEAPLRVARGGERVAKLPLQPLAAGDILEIEFSAVDALDGRRNGANAIELEEQRSKGIRRLDDVVRGAELQRRDRQLFIPLDHEDGADVGLTVGNVFQDLERIQARMIVLDEDDIEAGRDCRHRPVRCGHCLGDVDRQLKALEALPGKRGIADIQQSERRLGRARD